MEDRILAHSLNVSSSVRQIVGLRRRMALSIWILTEHLLMSYSVMLPYLAMTDSRPTLSIFCRYVHSSSNKMSRTTTAQVCQCRYLFFLWLQAVSEAAIDSAHQEQKDMEARCKLCLSALLSFCLLNVLFAIDIAIDACLLRACLLQWNFGSLSVKRSCLTARNCNDGCTWRLRPHQPRLLPLIFSLITCYLMSPRRIPRWQHTRLLRISPPTIILITPSIYIPPIRMFRHKLLRRLSFHTSICIMLQQLLKIRVVQMQQIWHLWMLWHRPQVSNQITSGKETCTRSGWSRAPSNRWETSRTDLNVHFNVSVLVRIIRSYVDKV